MGINSTLFQRLERLLLTPYFALFLIAAACWAAYFNSLSVPFYLDDVGSITNNKFFDNATYVSLFNDYGLRYLGYLGLWWNYEYAKLDVTSYHIVNTSIHMFTGVAVFFLTRKLTLLLGTFDTLDTPNSRQLHTAMACFVALVFVLHPLQSQGVTYIVQRLASQVALFYVGSLTFYLYARSATLLKTQFLFTLLSICFAVAACFTKQNAFTLPIIIVLCEWLVFKSISKKVTLVSLAAVVMTLLALFVFQNSLMPILEKVDTLTRETTDISRMEYFLAQLPILWNYIGKVFLPWPLQLEYDYTVDGFSQWVLIAAAIAHVAVVVCAVLVREKYPLVTWGVLFYYLTHIVESGVIPITDIAFEHRNYLPNVGLFIAVGFVAFRAIIKLRGGRTAWFVPSTLFLALLLIALGTLTVKRNQQWLSPELFLANDMTQAPKQARAIHNYAEFKLKQGEVQTALTLLEKLYSLDLKRIDAIMLNTHLAALIDAQQYKQAIQKGEMLLKQPLQAKARAIINSNMGIVYTNLQQYKKANTYFERAYGKASLPANSLIAYAYTSFVAGNYSRSTALCNQILSIEPQHRKARLLLSMIKEKKKGNVANE